MNALSSRDANVELLNLAVDSDDENADGNIRGGVSTQASASEMSDSSFLSEEIGFTGVEVWAESYLKLKSLPALYIKGARGIHQDIVNGWYLLTITDPVHPPVFRKAGQGGVWLYLAIRRWHIGNTDDMLMRRGTADVGYARSGYVEPGDLPSEIEDIWQTYHLPEVWEFQNNMVVLAYTLEGYKTKMPATLTADLWRAANIQIQDYPGIQVEYENGSFADIIEGTYVALLEDEDKPPAFKKVDEDRWVYMASDGCWHVGGPQRMKEENRAVKIVRSSKCKPGSLPSECDDWVVHLGKRCCCLDNWEKAGDSLIITLLATEDLDENDRPRNKKTLKKRMNKTAPRRKFQTSKKFKLVDAQDINPKIESMFTKMGQMLRMSKKEDNLVYLSLEGFEPVKQLDAYLLEDIFEIPEFKEKLGKFRTNFVNAATAVTSDKVRNHQVLEKHPGLTPQTLLAIVVFTLEVATFILQADYDAEFYRIYNTALRMQKRQIITKMAGYSHFLFAGLRNMPQYEGVLWRGIRDEEVVQETIANYSVKGMEVQWRAFSSASPNRQVAREFASKKGLLFRLEVFGQCRDIRDASAMPAESERLLLPNVRFKIDEPAHQAEDGHWEIHLVQVLTLSGPGGF